MHVSRSSHTKMFLKKIFSQNLTPCPSAPVKCAPVASPVDKFAEIAAPVPNYASSFNKSISFLIDHKETLSPVIFGKIGSLNRVFSAWS